MSFIFLTRFRYVALWLACKVGHAYRQLNKGWCPPVFWLAMTAFAVWIGEQLAVHMNLFNLKSGMLFQWWNILALYTLFALLWYAWQARKRVVVEEFVDYTGNPSGSTAKGLATLLVIRLAQLRELYQAVNEQRLNPTIIPTEIGVNQAIDTTIALNMDDVTGFLKGAISAESRLNLGPIGIPVGTLMALIGRFVQGPRIIGSLHNDKNLLILTAQRVGDKQAYGWRVDCPIVGEQENYSLDGMITELAYRVFTDLALKRGVRWIAMSTFSEGLQLYHEYLCTPKDRKMKLKLAEKKFIETLAEDNKFALAYYNLGVLYIESGRTEAAEAAFLEAINQNPSSWRACYALMVSHFLSGEYESVIQLCNRVIALKPGSANTAKAYHWKGLAQHHLNYQSYLNDLHRLEDLRDTVEQHRLVGLNAVIESRRRSVAQAWKALCVAELQGQGLGEVGNSVIPQLRTLASVCLSDLAVALSHQAERYGEQAYKYLGIRRSMLLQRRSRAFRKAETSFRQALFLTQSDAEYYFELGKMYFEWKKYNQAVHEYDCATRIQPKKAEFWAYLALAYATQNNNEAALYACEKVLDCASEASEDALEKTAQTFGRLGYTDQSQRVAGMKKFLQELKEDMEKGAVAVLHLKKRLELYDSQGQEWEYGQIALALGHFYLNSGYHLEAELHFGMAMERLKGGHSQEIRSQKLQALLASSLLDQGKYDEALRKSEEALSLDPLSFFVRNVHGEAYYKLNELEHAIAEWQEALLREPDIPDIYFKIGVSYVQLVQHSHDLLRREIAFRQGIAYLRQALDLYKSDQQEKKGATRYFLGLLHLEWRESEEAISSFKIAKVLNYSPLSSAFYLGYAYLQNKEYDECIETFRSLLKELERIDEDAGANAQIGERTPPDALLVLVNWGLSSVYAERDGEFNLAEAMKYVEVAEKYMNRLHEDDIKEVYSIINCSGTKGWIYYKQGNIAEAIACLEHAVSLSTNAEIYLHLALAYEYRLQHSKDQTELQFLVTRVRLHCQHVLELDIKGEYKQSVMDILQRLKGYEQLLKGLLQAKLTGKETAEG